jgi:hypothetical protein
MSSAKATHLIVVVRLLGQEARQQRRNDVGWENRVKTRTRRADSFSPNAIPTAAPAEIDAITPAETRDEKKHPTLSPLQMPQKSTRLVMSCSWQPCSKLYALPGSKQPIEALQPVAPPETEHATGVYTQPRNGSHESVVQTSPSSQTRVPDTLQFAMPVSTHVPVRHLLLKLQLYGVDTQPPDCTLQEPRMH